MKLAAAGLAQHSKQPLLPLYILSGEEALLLNEAADTLRRAARAQGFSERESHDANLPGFEWEPLLQSMNSLSLFAEKKLVELRCPKKSLNDPVFLAYWQHPNPDVVMVVVTDKLDKKTVDSQWFSALDKVGALVQVWPLKTEELPAWLAQRARQQGLQLSAAALAVLQQRVEGNLLAAVQELEKLYLLYGDAPIDEQQLADAVADSTRYDVFALVDKLLEGNSADSLRILHHLLEEDDKIVFALLPNLLRELRTLAQVREAVDGGQAAAGLLQRNGVWPQRQGLFQMALKRLTLQQIYQAIEQLARINLASMGLERIDVRDALQALCLMLCAPALRVPGSNFSRS